MARTNRYPDFRYDGQAGAAAITLQETSADAEGEFMNHLYKQLKKKGVPSYAIPRLVRLIEAYVHSSYKARHANQAMLICHASRVTVNATFKQLKGDLVKKAWDPRDGTGDKLYWLNGSKYEKLDTSSWSSIETGEAKL